MDFVELHRWFAPVRKDQDLDPHVGGFWGKRIHGWMDWSELRGHRRVVLLAEAASGKSKEFQNQAKILSKSGHSAFDVRIEELFDHGLSGALGPKELATFKCWLEASADGWFFLDSVDEARLNRKSFERALKRFALEAGDALERANIFISCRVTDWKEPEDRRAIADWLPCHQRPGQAAGANERESLLAPIFDESRSSRRNARSEEPKPEELLVVHLVPLNSSQAAALAAEAGVSETKAFSSAIVEAGLEVFQQRPGDVLDLATYWMEHGRFDSLSNMVDFGIERKLSERDPHRPDNDAVSPTQARSGAEQLAAALTLGKSFTLRAPGAETDLGLAGGAINPSAVLTNLSDAQRNALLRRGVFAPATFGRIRFHHRATQEYLTARWLHRLLLAGCSATEVHHLIFAERYGVATVVPSLRPAAAWLALWHGDICDEIITREPMVLIQHGDPRSLNISARRRLLVALAHNHSKGGVNDTSVDPRSFAMFADSQLADAIKLSWSINSRPEFRFILLSLIRDGEVRGCEDVLRNTVSDTREKDRNRLAALEAMVACSDIDAVKEFAQGFLKSPSDFSASMTSAAAGVLYPEFISTDELIKVIAKIEVSEEVSDGGFGYSIPSLYDAAPSVMDRRRLADGIAELCMQPPFVSSYSRVSKRYGHLARHLQIVAVAEVRNQDNRSPRHGLVRLLMAVERADSPYSDKDDGASLSKLVTERPALNRALMWADVADLRATRESSIGPVIRHWQVNWGGQRQLWGGGIGDIEWLAADAIELPNADDRRIAFSLLFAVLNENRDLPAAQQILRKLAASDIDLSKDLEDYLTVRGESEFDRDFRLKQEAREAERRERQSEHMASWLNFRDQVRADPGQLRRPENLASWSSGIFRLKHLTYWLERKTGYSDEAAARSWRLLTDGFGRHVAEAYRDGMMMLWRTVKPRRPKRAVGAGVTYQWPQILAFAGLSVAASEQAEWLGTLNEADAKRCALHACRAEQGCPEWLDSLISSHIHSVRLIVGRKLSEEWRSRARERAEFLFRYSRQEIVLSPPLQRLLLDSILSSEAGCVANIEKATAIISKIELDSIMRDRLRRVVNNRLSMHVLSDNEAFAIPYLAILYIVDPGAANAALDSWVGSDEPSPGSSRAARILSVIFDGVHRGLAVGALDVADVTALEWLLRFSYQHIRPVDDVHHVGSFTPDVRDGAESARGTILGKLIDRPGPDAYRALRILADDPAFSQRRERILELAHGKAERDSEAPAWKPPEVLLFEATHTAPVKTGADLMRVVLGVLGEINRDLRAADITSRSLLQMARDEDEVRNWLAEQLMLRSHRRFHAYRESVVSNRDRPDIIVASTAAQCEVAIELKHGGKRYTMSDLSRALRFQLAERYLKPEYRRHGIFVVSQHNSCVRLDTKTRRRLAFSDQIASLNDEAAQLVRNKNGAIFVKCVGVDATEHKDVYQKPRSRTPRLT